ncbi:RNA binding protein [Cryptosporidium ubiquitum]|uniref:RNA binding protein n=1 Tax=Cryptosporidium ubiquitum TaxID=857276 RepID=A0A1J4MPM9_9CRYT|nr:RNA binding protein [Cryptosporidium ubiquitum]OII74829.1 RNA binding protein [Cryptosporidium ubiquitum]
MQDEFIDQKLESELFSILSPELLNEIMMEEFPQIRLGPSVSQVLTTLTNGFLQDIVKNSFIISKHKNNPEVQADDILVYLKIKYPDTRLEEFCDTISRRRESKNGISNLINEENTISSSNGLPYTSAVKKNERKKELNFTWHPSTPDPYLNTSKSCFSGRLKEWKLRLHLWGNLDDLSYNYIVENNLKFPPGGNLNCCNTINYIKSILNNNNNNKEDLSFEFIKFSDLRISPISFSERNSLKKTIKTSKQQLMCASNSQMNSISLSEKILLPKIIDCKKSNDIMDYVTLFIPDNYKGILVWKSSNFVRHCDINSAANKYHSKLTEHGLSLFKFSERYNIDILGMAQYPNDGYLENIRIEASNFKRGNNELGKLRGVPSECIYSLVNSQKTISHRSSKVILTQNKLFGFRERDIFKPSFSYHPCTIIYCKILDKLSRENCNSTHFVFE